MSDENDSGGIIGSIISIIILAVIWPYLLAIFGLYMAYLAVLAIFEWITQNPQIVVLALLGLIVVFSIFYSRLIPKTLNWIVSQLKLRGGEIRMSQNEITKDVSGLVSRKFIPSTNLYCYCCTKKLGIKAWAKDNKFYCDECHDEINPTK